MNFKEIFTLELNEIQNRIDQDDVTVSVIGIGRIGLPTALSFARSGFETIGVDINEELVNKIKNKDFPLKDEAGYQEIFEQVIDKGKFNATTNIEEAVAKSEIILLSLPTPMDSENVPDYSALRTVGKQLRNLVKKGSIIIVESTIEPGFIENEFVESIESEGSEIKAGNNIGIGVCPETANPGEIMKDFERLPRLVGATDNKTAQIISKIYKHVFPVELIEMPNCKTANAVKLTTNVFRDVNIAFVNELALLFEKLGIDILTVLDAANKKYNFQVHFPGPGVGGPCLPVNSYQMLNSAKEIDGEFLKIIKASRKINEYMPYHVIGLIKDALDEVKKSLNSVNILILGISYKPNVKDIQLSPAEVIITELKKEGANVRILDPYFKNSTVYGIQTENNIDASISEIDVAVIVTAHKEFEKILPDYLMSKMKTPIVIDTRGIINRESAKESGLIFRGLGRGRI